MQSRILARLLAAVLVMSATVAPVPGLSGPLDPAKPRPDERYPGGWCGSHDDVYRRVRELHRKNLTRLEGVELPEKGINDRVIDDVIVVEDAGGDLVFFGVTDTIAIANRALDVVGDRFDFITVLTASTFGGNIEPEGGFAFALPINNDVLGTNNGPFADPEDPFVMTVINMNDLDEYPNGPDVVVPGFGVASGIEILGQEACHAFGSFIYAEPVDILGRDEAHWSFYMHSYGSVMEGNFWVDNGDGSFTTAPDSFQFHGYSQLDQYLWGLRPLEELTDPMWVIANPGLGVPDSTFPVGAVTTSGTRIDVTPEEIVSFNGPRDPAWPTAPREFSMAFVLAIPNGTQPSAADMANMQAFRESWETWFRLATDGRGVMHTAIDDRVAVSANFRASSRIGSAPLTTSLLNQSRGTVEGYLWEFGDGETSTEVSPTHTYTAPGTYSVRLTVEGEGGPVTHEKRDLVVVDDFGTLFVDDFEIDRGWTVVEPNDAVTGQWERGIPQQTSIGGELVQPGFDNTLGGQQAFVTGASAGGAAGSFDVDDGSTTLLSPTIDTMPFEQVYLSYARWISNNKGQAPGDDVLVVQASADGGSSWVTLERPGESLNRYRMPLFLLDELLPPTRTLRLRMIASDLGEGSLVEALIDDVLVVGVPLPDGDADGFPDVRDNCPLDSNAGQVDTDADTVGDVCDCAPVDAALSAAPSAVEQLRISRNPREGTVLEWDVPEQTASQDVISGDVADLRSSGSYEAASCLLDGIAAPPAFDTAPDPASGAGVYYLVRAVNACGGTFGDSGIKPDPRDALLDSTVCP